MPLPSIYYDGEPIEDPSIRADYYGEITRQSNIVLRRYGMEMLAFGGWRGQDAGFSTFGLFDPPVGGMVQGEE